jgi:hypothetical protein
MLCGYYEADHEIKDGACHSGIQAEPIYRCVGLAVHRRGVLLDPAIVAAAQQRAVLVEKRRPYRNPPFRKTEPGFLESNVQQRTIVELLVPVFPLLLPCLEKSTSDASAAGDGNCQVVLTRRMPSR